ncbi:hypothetical protein [Halospeciosus flavus]|uniref:Uncharacterized protein n=1 Tax=Halospeciosus flavus TaxID=3032283 RepID=A0ABD5Z636_9EURY|nr:hypothetical protein [Halospeciosus flavus]
MKEAEERNSRFHELDHGSSATVIHLHERNIHDSVSKCTNISEQQPTAWANTTIEVSFPAVRSNTGHDDAVVENAVRVARKYTESKEIIAQEMGSTFV